MCRFHLRCFTAPWEGTDCGLRRVRVVEPVAGENFGLPISRKSRILNSVTPETFRSEIAEAVKAYDKYVICIDKTPDEFKASLVSLLNKAIKAYETRGPQLRHGIALDRQITIILNYSRRPRDTPGTGPCG